MSQVTVVIPNYNGIKFLPECLDSLSKQKGNVGFRVLIVDNGSTDGSVEWIKSHAPETELICLDTNTGFCHAVNVGIQKAETPYVLLLNNDTKVYPDFVEKLYEGIEAREDAFSVGAQMLMWDKPELLDGAGDRYCALGWAFARGKGRRAQDYDRSERVFSACAGAAIYRKNILEEIGLFDEQHFAYLEDLDLGYRAQIYGYKNYYEPAAKVVHFGSASTGSRYNAWKTKQSSANNIYVIGKNMPLLQVLLNLPFLLPGFLVKWIFFCRKKMGKEYLEGIREGFGKLKTPEGKKAKIVFRGKHLKAYVSIQLQLYVGIWQFLKKS